jgi:hypothetical protein
MCIVLGVHLYSYVCENMDALREYEPAIKTGEAGHIPCLSTNIFLIIERFIEVSQQCLTHG